MYVFARIGSITMCTKYIFGNQSPYIHVVPSLFLAFLFDLIVWPRMATRRLARAVGIYTCNDRPAPNVCAHAHVYAFSRDTHAATEAAAAFMPAIHNVRMTKVVHSLHPAIRAFSALAFSVPARPQSLIDHFTAPLLVHTYTLSPSLSFPLSTTFLDFSLLGRGSHHYSSFCVYSSNQRITEAA